MVDDDGPGIPAHERRDVFKAFHRAESSRSRSTGGTGLGLAIAHGIVERQHGGGIDITDAPSGGARVSVYLPTTNI
jgi:two-component system osmolarity sensor histidine kinase EnvZ